MAVHQGFETIEYTEKVASNHLLARGKGAVRIWVKTLKRGVQRFGFTSQDAVPSWKGEWTPLHDVVYIAESESTERREIPSSE